MLDWFSVERHTSGKTGNSDGKKKKNHLKLLYQQNEVLESHLSFFSVMLVLSAPFQSYLI